MRNKKRESYTCWRNNPWLVEKSAKETAVAVWVQALAALCRWAVSSRPIENLLGVNNRHRDAGFCNRFMVSIIPTNAPGCASILLVFSDIFCMKKRTPMMNAQYS